MNDLPLSESPITIRAAVLADGLELFLWRNDIRVREMSVNQGEITIEEHIAWLKRALLDPKRTIFIGELTNGTKAGVVRFDTDCERGEVTVNITVNPTIRGRGLSVPLLGAAIGSFAKYFKESGNPLKLIAQIRHDNAASLACFKRAAFEPWREDDKFSFLIRDLVRGVAE